MGRSMLSNFCITSSPCTHPFNPPSPSHPFLPPSLPPFLSFQPMIEFLLQMQAQAVPADTREIKVREGGREGRMDGKKRGAVY